MPKGGARIGAGRKPKIPGARSFGNRVVPVAPPTTNGSSPIEEFDAPDDLSAEERAVWLKQAQHAFKNRTLTRAKAMAFERYCKLVVLERNEAKSSGVGGANHRGLLKLIRDYEKEFGLAPNGREVIAEAPTANEQDEDDQFFGGPIGVVSRSA